MDVEEFDLRLVAAPASSSYPDVLMVSARALSLDLVLQASDFVHPSGPGGRECEDVFEGVLTNPSPPAPPSRRLDLRKKGPVRNRDESVVVPGVGSSLQRHGSPVGVGLPRLAPRLARLVMGVVGPAVLGEEVSEETQGPTSLVEAEGSTPLCRAQTCHTGPQVSDVTDTRHQIRDTGHRVRGVETGGRTGCRVPPLSLRPPLVEGGRPDVAVLVAPVVPLVGQVGPPVHLRPSRSDST